MSVHGIYPIGCIHKRGLFDSNEDLDTFSQEFSSIMKSASVEGYRHLKEVSRGHQQLYLGYGYNTEKKELDPIAWTLDTSVSPEWLERIKTDLLDSVGGRAFHTENVRIQRMSEL